jgi:S-DNA-T family DNA segregation ATPase FtsK/SpoIIIE
VARKRKRPESRSRFREEAIGFLCLAAATFLAVALISYDAADPNPFDLAADGSTDNWAGPVGATLAAAAFQLVGLGAWLCAVVLALAGFNRIRGRKLESPFTKTLGTTVLTASVCGLATMVFGEISWGGGGFAAGGVVGSLTAMALFSAFGPVGGPLVAVTAALLAIVAATRLSIEGMLATAWKSMVAAVRRTRTSLAHRREQRRKAKARRNVIAKHTARESKSQDDADVTEAERNAAARALLKVKVPVNVTRPDAELPKVMVAAAGEGDAAPPPIRRKTPQEVPPEPDPLPFEQPAGPNGSYALPDAELLDQPSPHLAVDESEFVEKAKAIASKGAEFKVTGEVVAIHPGPVVTTYEFRPSAGVKYSRILNLEEDLSLALKAESIRIARLPGKSTVGIEAPNSTRKIIRIRELFESKEFARSRSKLTLAIGKEIHGENVVTDLARAPHLLIAGTTGSGKSVAMNAMLMSLLYKATPDEVKLVLVDPKRLEFGLYEDIPHLLTPVVVDPDRAANALGWAVREMEKRYRSLAEFGVRNIEQFNMMLQRGEEEMIARARKSRAAAGKSDEVTSSELKPLPYVVVCIDELADLMMTSSASVEACIMRLAQMARAVGIHLILATQRPSVDVITGTIKNNLPARISFRVASKTDSRVILDSHGAESLLGKGDMLFLAPGTSRLQRVHGAYVEEDEVRAVVDFWRNQARPTFEQDVTLPPPEDADAKGGNEERGDRDEYFEEALQLVLSAGEASISNIQRKLRLGYARAGRIVDMMEEEGLVGPPEGSKPRRLLVDASYVAQKYGSSAAPPQ